MPKYNGDCEDFDSGPHQINRLGDLGYPIWTILRYNVLDGEVQKLLKESEVLNGETTSE